MFYWDLFLADFFFFCGNCTRNFLLEKMLHLLLQGTLATSQELCLCQAQTGESISQRKCETSLQAQVHQGLGASGSRGELSFIPGVPRAEMSLRLLPWAETGLCPSPSHWAGFRVPAACKGLSCYSPACMAPVPPTWSLCRCIGADSQSIVGRAGPPSALYTLSLSCLYFFALGFPLYFLWAQLII